MKSTREKREKFCTLALCTAKPYGDREPPPARPKGEAFDVNHRKLTPDRRPTTLYCPVHVTTSEIADKEREVGRLTTTSYEDLEHKVEVNLLEPLELCETTYGAQVDNLIVQNFKTGNPDFDAAMEDPGT